MRLEEHYLHLRESFPQLGEEEPFPITIAEISEILLCTQRYAKMVVKKMNENNWINWEVFKGRGKKPFLTFLITKPDMEQLLVKELIVDHKYTEVIEKLNHYHVTLHQDIEQFLRNYFGFSVEQIHESEQKLDTLRYPLQQKLRNLDPLIRVTRLNNQLIKHIYDTLLTFDPITQSVRPHLCFHWEHDETGKEWLFYLRKGVTFHDGTALSAEDVAFSLSRAFHYYETSYEKPTINALHSYLVKIVCKQPNFLLPNILCNTATSIVPKDLEKKHKLIGSGPFQVNHFQEEKMVLVANEHYFHLRPHIDRLEFIYIPVHYQSKSLLFNYDDLLSMNEEERKILNEMIYTTAYISVHSNRQGIHNNPYVRKALLEIISYYQSTMDDGFRTPAYGFIYNEKKEINDKKDKLVLKSQIEELLKEANYKNEVIEFCIIYSGGVLNQLPYAKEIVALAESFGINLHLQYITGKEDKEIQELTKNAALILRSLVIEEDVLLTLYSIFDSPTTFVLNTLTEDRKAYFQERLFGIRKNSKLKEQLEQLFMIEKELTANLDILFLSHTHYYSYFKQQDNLEGLNFLLTGGVNYSNIWFKKEL